MRFNRMAAIAIMSAGGIVLPLLSMSAQPAQAASSRMAATTPTSFQVNTLGAALRNNPSGVQIAADEVSWDNGSVIMVVPATPDAGTGGCPGGVLTGQWSCVYSQTHFEGTRLQFQDAGYAQDLQHYGGNGWKTMSWSNTRGQRTWIRPDQFDGNGPELCMTGNAASYTVAEQYIRNRWIYLTTNYAACPGT
jgi:hypothetical protein